MNKILKSLSPLAMLIDNPDNLKYLSPAAMLFSSDKKDKDTDINNQNQTAKETSTVFKTEKEYSSGGLVSRQVSGFGKARKR
jgi:hypothetical protein